MKVVIISHKLKKLTPINKPKLPPMFAIKEKLSHCGNSSDIEYDNDDQFLQLIFRLKVKLN